MKKAICFVLMILCVFAGICLTGCEGPEKEQELPETELLENGNLPYEFTDASGNSVTVQSLDSVVVLYGSFAEVWMLAGGELTGTTEDAIEERNLELSEDVKIVGTVKAPNLEEILALEPTFVILSADIESHQGIGVFLTQMEIPHAYMRIDDFDDYLNLLKIATAMTEREELYQINGVDIKEEIAYILSRIQDTKAPKILFLRAYSTGAKAKTDDNFTGIMLEDLGTVNIANEHPSLLEELSLEEIILEDPEYIFVTTMGDEQQALEALDNYIMENPAWNSLSAVEEGKFIVLPKDLFHYKPNHRWAESYKYLAEILYPEVF